MGALPKGSLEFFRLSPVEREALGGFAVKRGEVRERLDAVYAADMQLLADRYATPNFPLVPLGSVATKVQYGTSARSVEEQVGTPVLRIPNLQLDGWALDDLKYLELSESELANYRLEHGDILFNRTNGSRELVGKCEVFDFDGDWAFASYLIRLRIDPGQANPYFVSAFLNTKWGRRQVEHASRQILMSNINAEEIRALRIPMPDLPIQATLLATLDAARAARDAGLAAADAALDGLDAFILGELGLTLPPPRDPAAPFAMRSGALRGGRLDPQSLAPMGLPVNSRGLPFVDVGSVLAEPNRVAADHEADDEVPYVGLPECDLHEVREIASRRYAEVGGRSVARAGDILFARIEPSVFNRKYVFAETLGDEGWAFLSTEFYAVRARGAASNQRYLYALLLSDIVQRQVRGKTTGTSGRRRLDRDMFDSMLIPWPECEERAAIAAEVDRRRAEARRLRADARAGWAAARQAFEDALLGPAA